MRRRPLVLRTQQRVSIRPIPAISTAGHAREQRHSPLCCCAFILTTRYTRLAPHPTADPPPTHLPTISDTRIPSSLRRLTEFAPPVYLAAPTLAVSASFPPRLTVPYLTSRLPFFVLLFVRSSTLCPFYHNRSSPHSVHILPPPPPYLPRTLACYAITHYPSIVM